MDKSIIWAVCIKNSICVICWTVLAILFNQWWIALFALLFLSGINTIRRYYRVCDGCGERSDSAGSVAEALTKAEKAGWLHVVEGNRDYCPKCRGYHNHC